MSRKYKRMAILAKLETTYGEDAVPTGAANAMLMTAVSITPMEGETVSRDLMLPYLGHQGVQLTGEYASLEGSIELAGAGVAGDVPAYGALLRACALSETITENTQVEYSPVSSGEEAVSIYYNQDGVRHVLLGARGTFTMDFTPKQIPKLAFKFTGLLGTISDEALPVADTAAFQAPVAVSKANTTFALHGQDRIIESLSIDLANTIEPRHLIGYEGVAFTDRQTTGTSVVEATALTGGNNANWFAIASARTRGALALAHGKTAGHIVEVSAPQVEIGRPTQGQSQNIVNYSLPLIFVPTTAGNDELTLTAK